MNVVMNNRAISNNENGYQFIENTTFDNFGFLQVK